MLPYLKRSNYCPIMIWKSISSNRNCFSRNNNPKVITEHIALKNNGSKHPNSSVKLL